MSRIPAIMRHGTSGCRCRNGSESRLTASSRTMSWWMVADWVFGSARNAALSASPRKLTTRRAALTMSRSAASSGDIDRFGGRQDGASPDPVVAALDGAAADEVDLPAQDGGQLLLHRDGVPQAPVRVRREAHEHIDVAVRAEVVA